MPELTAEPLDAGSIAELAAALGDAGLPTDDLGEPGRAFFRFRDEAGMVVAYGGMEPCGAAVLLRSIVTLPSARGRGHGRAVLDWLAARAARDGAEELYLLTTTAAPFFAAAGFETADRATAPAAVTASRQFSSLCPASATFLRRVP